MVEREREGESTRHTRTRMNNIALLEFTASLYRRRDIKLDTISMAIVGAFCGIAQCFWNLCARIDIEWVRLAMASKIHNNENW